MCLFPQRRQDRNGHSWNSALATPSAFSSYSAKLQKTERMPRTHCRSQYLKLLFILEISIELPPLLHGSHGLVSIRRSRFSAGSALPEISTDASIDESVKQFEWEIADRRPNPEDHYIELEKHRRLQSAISKLPKRLRHVVESRRRSEASIKEIAKEAGITIAATKSRLLRARKTLRSSMLK